MIPKKVEQFLKNLNEPDFFIDENRAECTEIHDHIRKYVENGTETIAISIDEDLLRQAEMMLNTYGWTIEKATALFFMWCVACPKEMSAWCTKMQGGEMK